MVNSIKAVMTICVAIDEIISETGILNKLNNSIILYSHRLGFEGVE